MNLQQIIEEKAAELVAAINEETGLLVREIHIESQKPASTSWHIVRVEFDERMPLLGAES